MYEDEYSNGDGGGGFFAAPDGGGGSWEDGSGSDGAAAAAGSAGQHGRKKKARDNALVPATVSMILNTHFPPNSPVGNYKGLTMGQVSLVGLVISQSDLSSGMKYELEDGSDTIDAMRYRDQEHAGTEEDAQDMTMRYVQVIARVSSSPLQFGSTPPKLTILDLRPIEDSNQLTYHWLACIHAVIRATRTKRPEVAALTQADELKSSYPSSFGTSYSASASTVYAASPLSTYEAAGPPGGLKYEGGGEFNSRRGGRMTADPAHHPMAYQSPQSVMKGIQVMVYNALSGHPSLQSEHGVRRQELQSCVHCTEAELTAALEQLGQLNEQSRGN